MLELQIPDEAGTMFMELSKGGYLVKGEKSFSMLNEHKEAMSQFCQLFKHHLHVADYGYAYIESFSRGAVSQKHKQYLALFAVFFPLFIKKNSSSLNAWHRDITLQSVDMSSYNYFGLMNDAELLESVKISNIDDIKDLLKKMSDDKILKVHDGLKVFFKPPVHRFINIFQEMDFEGILPNQEGEEDA